MQIDEKTKIQCPLMSLLNHLPSLKSQNRAAIEDQDGHMEMQRRPHKLYEKKVKLLVLEIC